MRGGERLSVGTEALLLVIGAASGSAYSPLFARALSRVAPADAADASGVTVTMVQLGQVVGVSLLGTVFLSSVSYPAGPAASGHAVEVTSFCLLAAALLAAVFAFRTRHAARLT